MLFFESWTDAFSQLAPSLGLNSSVLLYLFVELCKKNAGLEGMGRVREEVLNIITTVVIVGRFVTFSWTHNSPIWMHLIISILEPMVSVESMTFEIVPAIQFVHACVAKVHNNYTHCCLVAWYMLSICKHILRIESSTYKAGEIFRKFFIVKRVVFLTTQNLKH